MVRRSEIPGKLAGWFEGRGPKEASYEPARIETLGHVARTAAIILDLPAVATTDSGQLEIWGIVDRPAFSLGKSGRDPARIRVAKHPDRQGYDFDYSMSNSLLDCKVVLDQNQGPAHHQGIARHYQAHITRPNRYDMFRVSESQAQALLQDLKNLAVESTD